MEFLSEIFEDKNFWKKPLIYAVILILLSVLMFFFVVNPLMGESSDGSEYTVSLDLVTTVSDTFSLYYDNGTPSHFDEAHVVTASVKGSSSFQTVKFDIPIEGVSYLRFTLASQSNVTFRIRSITIENASRVQKFTYNEIANIFDIVEKMSRFTDHDGYTTIKSTRAGGAYFTNTRPIEPKNVKATLPFISFAMAFVLLACVMYFVNSVKNGKKLSELVSDPTTLLILSLIIGVVLLLVFGLAVSPLENVAAGHTVKSIVLCAITVVLLLISIIRAVKTKQKASVLAVIPVVLIGAVLVSSIVGSLFFTPSEDLEAEDVPNFTLARFMNYSEEATSFFESENPLNGQYSDLYTDIKTTVFADSQYDDVLIGKNGFLFSSSELNDFKRLNTFSKENLVAIRDKLLNWERTFNGQGIDFFILIVPNKSSIYEDMMPSSVRRTAREDRLTQVYDYLWKYSDMNVVEIRDQLISASYSGYVYYRTDNYLTDDGAFTATNVLLSKMAAVYEDEEIEFLDAESYEIEPAESLVKQLAMSMDKADSYTEMVNKYTLKRKSKAVIETDVVYPFRQYTDTERPKDYDVDAIYGPGIAAQLAADGTDYLKQPYINSKNTGALNDKHIVVVHDEALLPLVPFFNEAFSEVSYIFSDDWTTRSVISEAPDAVVFEITEQTLASLLK